MRKSLFIGLIAILGLLGCSRNQEIDVPDANLSLFARTESPADTKTVVESGVHVFWEPGDEIAVFTGDQSAKFTTDITAASGTAIFNGTFGDATWPEDLDLWAVYPFSEDAVFDGETIMTTLPSEQVAREGSFGKDMNLAIAHSNSSTLQFYNVGGGIRFSVTEEGIKKVMFEGLSGEIISGKVKIGFEDGLPVVKEVTGGSQFITLLPPDGSETFQKDTWYYIVAIPGSLEGGYKLRFYKDSDYARKVSEKKVEIKRSIFGSLEKADSGIDFEPQTTHFPETEEEWEASEQRVHYIGERVYNLINSDDKKTIEQIKEGILGIEGVLDVYINEDSGTTSILQKDSLWLFILPPKIDLHLKGIQLNRNASATFSPQKQKKEASNNTNTITRSNSNAKNKALILAPYFGESSKNIKKHLLNAGFQENNIDIKEDIEANVILFKGGFLAKHRFIYFDSHGGTFYYTDPNNQDETTIKNQTIVLTGTPFSNAYSYGLTREQIAVASAVEGDYRFCMIPSFVNETDFSLNKPLFFFGTCESAKIENNLDGRGSMVGTLLTNHAGAIAGYSDSVSDVISDVYVDYVTEFMAAGFSFQQASRYWKESEIFNRFSKSIQFYLLNPFLWDEEDRTNLGKLSEQELKEIVYGCDYKLYRYYPISDNFFYLINPYPQLNTPSTNSDFTTSFSWECELKPFTETLDFEEYKEGVCSIYKKTITCSVEYDLYIDDHYKITTYGDEESAKTAIVSDLQADEHSWYVIGKLILDGKVEASYKSEVKKFTVKGKLQAIDLGLSVKWANMNFGANKQEDYGDFFAWGETEQYYSSLVPLMWEPDKQYGYNWMHYKWAMGSETTLTKYCSDAAYGYNGFTDGKITLDPEDDAAQVNLGDKWRMPTRAEILELMNECSWEWTTMDGVGGRKVTGPSGEFIFLPAAGDWDGTSHLNDANSNNPNGALGFYASSSLNTGNPNQSYFLSFGSGGKACYSNSRALGYTIRPVYGDPVISVDGDGNLDDIPGHNI